MLVQFMMNTRIGEKNGLRVCSKVTMQTRLVCLRFDARRNALIILKNVQLVAGHMSNVENQMHFFSLGRSKLVC